VSEHIIEVKTTRYTNRIVENEDERTVPVQFYDYYVRADRGDFRRVKQTIDWKLDEFNVAHMISSTTDLQPERGAPVLDWEEVNKCYDMMEKEDISVITAVKRLFGDEEMNSGWLQDCVECKLYKWKPVEPLIVTPGTERITSPTPEARMVSAAPRVSD